MSIVWLLLACADPPLVVPNAPSECTGVAFSAPADGPDAGEPLKGTLSGADGECWLLNATDEVESLWSITIASRAFRGEVRCTTSGRASPRFLVSELEATPSPEIGGSWLDDDGGSCVARQFPETGATVAIPHVSTPEVPTVPNSPTVCAGVTWTAEADAACPQPEKEHPERGTLLGAEGGCMLLDAEEGPPLWTFTVPSAEFRGRVRCQTAHCKSAVFSVSDPDRAPIAAAAGLWLAKEPAPDEHGHVSNDCREASFPGGGIHIFDLP